MTRVENNYYFLDIMVGYGYGYNHNNHVTINGYL